MSGILDFLDKAAKVVNPVSSLLGAGSGIIGSIIGANAAKQQQGREFEQQEKMMNMQNAEQEKMMQMQQDFNRSEREQQNQFNLAQWQRENEWNSPQAQLKRAMDAGINPNSVFGQGQYGAIQSAHIEGGSAQAGLGSAAGPGSIPSIANAMAGLSSSAFDNMLKLAQARGQNIENEFKPALNSTQIKEMEQHIQLMVKEGTLKEEEANQIRTLLPLTQQCTTEQIAKFKAEIDNLIADTENKKETKKQISATTENIVADTELKRMEKSNISYDISEKQWYKVIRDTLGINPKGELGTQLITLLMRNPSQASQLVQTLVTSIGEVVDGGIDAIGRTFGNKFGGIRDTFWNPSIKGKIKGSNEYQGAKSIYNFGKKVGRKVHQLSEWSLRNGAS